MDRAVPDFDKFVGVGIYTIPEAAKLTKVPARSIQRWIAGYTYKNKGVERFSPPVVHPELPSVDDQVSLTFEELMELGLVEAFRRHGVSWKMIRTAAQKAADLFNSKHPFALQQFRTDGRNVFLYLSTETSERAVINLAKDQFIFNSVVEPSMLKDVVYRPDGSPLTWWPLGGNRRVVLDPERSFGRPIDPVTGVSASTLAQAYRVELSFEDVADFYEVDEQAVRDAVEFDRYLARTA